MNFIERILMRYLKRRVKIDNLHKVIDKQALKLKRQAARITNLEALYAGTVESKNHKTLQEKYAKLKQKLDWLRSNYGGWDDD